MEVGRDSRIKVGRNRQNWIEVGRYRDRSIETVFQTEIKRQRWRKTRIQTRWTSRRNVRETGTKRQETETL